MVDIQNNNQNRSIEREQEQRQREQDAPGTPEEAFKAATHGTDEAKPSHPGHVEHAKEPTGRHADEIWKTREKAREQ